MAAANHMEEEMGDLFDHIEDLLDFPCDDDGVNALPPIPPPLAADGALAAAGDDSLECSSEQKPRDEVDIAELEWTTAFQGGGSDCFLFDLQYYGATKPRAFFCAASPVSVLETKPKSSIGGADSSNSSFSSTSASYFGDVDNEVVLSGPTTLPEAALAPAIPSRARSKRRRNAAFSPRPHAATRFIPPSSDSAAIPDPESFGEFCPAPLPTPAKKIKITFKKKSAVATTADEEEDWGAPSPVAARKCLHCGAQKTPQWRAGPMGPKTLCNACGVRYNSGRLFPEYRPAASPTFVPALHSNSHKKVVEMRIQATKRTSAPAFDGCDLLEYIRRRH